MMHGQQNLKEKEKQRVLVEMIRSVPLILCCFNAHFAGTSNT